MHEMIGTMMQDENVTITGDLSANEDLDMPNAIINFKSNQNIYQAALSVGAKIMPTSLVDFLR